MPKRLIMLAPTAMIAECLVVRGLWWDVEDVKD